MKTKLLGVIVFLLGTSIAVLLSTRTHFPDKLFLEPPPAGPSFEVTHDTVESRWGAKGTQLGFTAPGMYKAFTLAFEFKVDGVRPFDNLFQTTGLNRGLRVEIVPEGNESYRLFCLLSLDGSGDHFHSFPIGNLYHTKTDYTVRIWIDEQGVFRNSVNGIEETQGSYKGRFLVDDVKLGIGFDASRSFNGLIKSFTLQLSKDGANYKILPTFNIVKTVLGVLALLFCFFLVRLAGRVWLSSPGNGVANVLLYLQQGPGLLLLSLPVLFLGLFYFISTFDFPLSEDSGYYAFLSRAISQGVVLHNSVPATTNSLSVYALALLFSLFGSTVFLFRLFNIVPLLLLCFLVVFIFARRKQPLQAIIASVGVFLLALIPHVTVDLGRHNMFWPLFLCFLAVATLTFLKSRWVFYFGGFLLGLAAISRETFLMIPLAVILYWCVRVFLPGTPEESNAKARWRESGELLFGIILGLMPNAVILTIQGSWGTYLQDMLGTGVAFRYSAGLFSFERIAQNIDSVTYGFTNRYAFIVLLGIASFFLKSDHDFFRVIKFALIPGLFLESFVLNKMFTYHIIPLLFAFAVLGTQSLVALVGFIRSKATLNLKLAGFLFFCSLAIALLPPQLAAIIGEYSFYINSQRELVSTDPLKTNEFTRRLIPLLEVIPHKTIGVMNNYPLLFASTKFYHTEEILEDLLAPQNLFRRDLAEKQAKKLQQGIPDLLVTQFLENKRDYKPEIQNNYVTLASFNPASGWTRPYQSEIMISRRYLEQDFIRERLLSPHELTSSGEDISSENTPSQHFGILHLSVVSETPASLELTSGIYTSSSTQGPSGQQEFWLAILPGAAFSVHGFTKDLTVEVAEVLVPRSP